MGNQPEHKDEYYEDHDDKAYNDYFNSDGEKGHFFGPRYDDIFKKLETGVEDEIHTSPNYDVQGGTYQESRSNPEQEYEQRRQNRHYTYQNNNNNPDEDENYDEVT